MDGSIAVVAGPAVAVRWGVDRKARRERAEEMLREGHMVSEVAEALGYSSSATFGRAFRAWTGVLPRDWRRAHRPLERPVLPGRASALAPDRLFQKRVMSRSILESTLGGLVEDRDALAAFLDDHDLAGGAAAPDMVVEPYEFPDAITSWLGDDSWGLRAAAALSPETLGVVWQLFQQCATVRDAVACAERIFALVNADFSLEFSETAEIAKFTLVSPLVPHRQSAELHLGTLVRVGQAIGGPGAPVRVLFRHPVPERVTPHREFFDCPVLFGQSENAMLFPSATLERRLAPRDRDAYQQLVRRSESLIADRKKARCSEVEQAYVRAAVEGASIEQIARRLGMSVRTLQRHLRDAGTNHRDLRDRALAQEAASMLAVANASVAETARRLRFASPASFTRAFRRWTGMAPGEYARLFGRR